MLSQLPLRGVSLESLGVHRGPGIHIRSALDKPSRHVDVVELERQVQERAAGHGRRRIGISCRAVECRREDFAVRESALQEQRVSIEVLLEQVEPSAVQRHHGSVREREAGRLDLRRRWPA